MANPPGSGDQALLQAYDDDEEGFRVVVTAPVDLEAGDFQVGAVELKDGASDNRAAVSADGEVAVDTELPDAAALADGTANPTAPAVGAFLFGWNGTTWERIRLSTLNRAMLVAAAGTVAPNDAVANAGFTGLVGTAGSGTGVFTALAVFNGATWDRVRGDIANGIDVDVTRLPSSGAATLTNVADSASSVTLLAANASRKGAICHNDSDQPLKLKYGAAASATSFTVEIAANGYWEMPAPIYTGIIDGIWDADGSGAARMTELT